MGRTLAALVLSLCPVQGLTDEAKCPSGSEVIERGTRILFEDVSDAWYTFPLEPAPVVIAPEDLRPFGRGGQPEQSFQFPLSPRHAKIVATGLVSMEVLDGPAMTTSTEWPALPMAFAIAPEIAARLGDDVEFATRHGFDVVQIRAHFDIANVGDVTVNAQASNEDGVTTTIYQANVVMIPNEVALRYFARAGLYIGELTVIVQARCDPNTVDFLGRPLFAIDTVAMAHGSARRDLTQE